MMGFALLLAAKHETSTTLAIGGAIALLLLFCAGMLRNIFGWLLGSFLQIAIIAYGVIVTPLFFLGVIFSGLWISAIVVGRKGEASRAALLQARESEVG